MAEFSENRHISNLINMSCKVLKPSPNRANFLLFLRFPHSRIVSPRVPQPHTHTHTHLAFISIDWANNY